MGAIGKTPETFKHTANGLLPSATFTHAPLNNYKTFNSKPWAVTA